MGLADELKTLQELNEKGKLSDQEYAHAKAATLKKYADPVPTGPASRPCIRPLTSLTSFLLLVLLLLLGLAWYNAGTRNTTRMLSTMVHAPITLTDEIENLPAASWKALPFNLPSGGTLDINLQVIRGNPIDVLLTTADQLETMKKEQWNNVRVFGDFNAVKTKTYSSALLGPGSYYLVLHDTSLGILSSSASDISVKVQLTP